MGLVVRTHTLFDVGTTNDDGSPTTHTIIPYVDGDPHVPSESRQQSQVRGG
jgi:hypothetical protein